MNLENWKCGKVEESRYGVVLGTGSLTYRSLKSERAYPFPPYPPNTKKKCKIILNKVSEDLNRKFTQLFIENIDNLLRILMISLPVKIKHDFQTKKKK